MLSLRPTRDCWICGKAVPLETCKTDEHGNPVHERCYAAKLALDWMRKRPIQAQHRASFGDAT